MKISLLALGATSIAQLVIVVISGSVALLADTIHNFSDALTAIPLWIAFALGTKAATRRYTYGYGRAEDLAGLFVIAMITLSAIIAGIESVRRLINPVPIQHVGWVAAAGLVGFIGNELVAIYRIRVGRQIGSAALIADGLHARTDGFTSLAVLLGAGGVALGFPLADPIIGLAHHRRDPGRTAHRRARRVPAPNGRHRPDTRRRRRSRTGRRTRRHRRAQRQDALDRTPHPRRRRTRHRPRHQPHRGPPDRARRRTHPHPRRPEALLRPRARLPFTHRYSLRTPRKPLRGQGYGQTNYSAQSDTADYQ